MPHNATILIFYLLVNLFFVAVYSILPHKELRFVLYAVPPLNVAAGAALAKLHAKLPDTRRAKSGGARAWARRDTLGLDKMRPAAV